MYISDLLLKLGIHVGIEGLALNDNNICCLSIQEGMEIFIEHDDQEQHTHLYSVLGQLPDNRRAVFYEEIFKRNLFGWQTGKAHICCDMEQNEILLCQIFDPQPLDGESFIQVMEIFTACAIEQRDWVNEFDAAPEKSTFSGQSLDRSESNMLKI